MAKKIQGQAKPAAATNGDLVDPAALTEVTLSTVAVCNTGVATTFRLHPRMAGAAAAVGNASNYDTPIQANTTVYLTVGMTLNGDSGDILTCRSASGDVTFTAFGMDESTV